MLEDNWAFNQAGSVSGNSLHLAGILTPLWIDFLALSARRGVGTEDVDQSQKSETAISSNRESVPILIVCNGEEEERILTMGSYMLVVLLTIDSARLDSIMFTIVFSGYNMGRQRWVGRDRVWCHYL